MSSIRLFVAFETPPAVMQALRPLLSDLRKNVHGVRWEPDEKLHTTLRFFGETAEELLPSLDSVLRTTAAAAPTTITVRYEAVGFFPDVRRPRVVWIGIDDPSGGIAGLRNRLDVGIEPLGFRPEERPFSPHLTLGRVRDPHAATGLIAKVETVTFRSDPVPIRAMTLFRSRLTPEGSVYSVRARYPFGASA